LGHWGDVPHNRFGGSITIQVCNLREILTIANIFNNFFLVAQKWQFGSSKNLKVSALGELAPTLIVGTW
jgi:hypothetical protein